MRKSIFPLLAFTFLQQTLAMDHPQKSIPWELLNGTKRSNEEALLTSTPKTNLDNKLIEAAKANQPDRVITLLAHGANIHTKDEEGNTALILAAHSGNANICKILLEHGANTSIRNNDGMNAFMRCFYLTEPFHLPYTCNGLFEGGLNPNLIHRLIRGRGDFSYYFVDNKVKDKNGEIIHEPSWSTAWFLKWIRPFEIDMQDAKSLMLHKQLAICSLLIKKQKELERAMIAFLLCLKHSDLPSAHMLYKLRKDLLRPYLESFTIKAMTKRLRQ